MGSTVASIFNSTMFTPLFIKATHFDVYESIWIYSFVKYPWSLWNTIILTARCTVDRETNHFTLLLIDLYKVFTTVCDKKKKMDGTGVGRVSVCVGGGVGEVQVGVGE